MEWLLKYIVLPLLVCFFLLKKRFNYWKNLGIPSTSPNTFLGDLVDVGSKYHFSHKLDVIYKKFRSSRFGGMFSTISPVLMVTDLELVKRIMVQDFNYFIDHDFYHNEKDDPLSVNLLTLEGERWKRRRALLSPLFTSGKLKNMFNIIVEKSKELVSVGNTNGSLEVRQLSQNYTMKALGSCVFGIDFDTENSQIKTLQTIIFGKPNRFNAIRFLFMAAFPTIASKFRMRFNDKRMEDFVLDMVSTNIKHREATGTRRDDLLDMLMDIKREQKLSAVEEFTFTKLAAEALIFFGGGFDTSASTMSWALFELARNQPFQDELRKEIRKTKEKYDGKITYEGIAEMEYLDKVFNETLRLYPPFPFHTRKVTQNYTIPKTNIVLEKGTVIWIPVHSIQRDEKYFENPNEFQPEHYSKEAVRGRDSMASMAFGDGPRICIGLRFAQLQTKIGIATVIDNFKITVNHKTELPIQLDLVQAVVPVAKGGLWINMEKCQ